MTSRQAAAAMALVVGALAVGGLAFFLSRGGGASGKEDISPAPAPDFHLPDLSGKPEALSDFKGRVALVDFWATWCAPCEEELPDLKRLYSSFKDRGFVIIGVDMDEQGPAVVRDYVRKNEIPYPILLAGGDPPRGYPVIGFPTAFLVDRKGNLRERYQGNISYEELAPAIEKLLSE